MCIRDRFQSTRVRLCGVMTQASAAQHIGSRRVEQMIVVELSATLEWCQEFKRTTGTFDHSDGYGTVQADDRRWLNTFERAVELHNLSPVRVLRSLRLAMHRSNRGLKSKGART